MSTCLKWSGILHLIIIGSLVALIEPHEDTPYEVLQVHKSATVQEIRQAYKQLAKEWHPDKNNNPGAEEKFVRIKKAYELLIDTDRRRLYDLHGITNEDSHFLNRKHDYSQYQRFANAPFEEFFGDHFQFDHDISLFHKLSITSRYFQQTVLQKSATKPQIIIFYNDWCFRCIRLIGSLKKIINKLEPIGIQFSSVNAAHEPQLVQKVGISDVPESALILDGHIYIYKEKVYSIPKVVDFVRSKMPFKVSQNVDDKNIDEFLSGWMDNKVRALIFESRNVTRLRYLLNAFAFRHRVVFGFVELGDKSLILKQRYNLHPNHDTLLIFNEDTIQPVASVSMYDIPTQTMQNIISANQYLSLPRLSSQDVFEGICPAEWHRPRKRLCVVLITENSNTNNLATETFRLIAKQTIYNKERVRFAYIFKEKQNAFLNAISKGSSLNTLLPVVVIWRRDASHIKYEWISTDVDVNNIHLENREHFLNITKQNIEDALQKFLKASEALAYEAFVHNLLDEHAQGLVSKWISKFLYLIEYIMDHIEHEHILAALSIFGTVIFMIAVGYTMLYFVKVEEESLKAKGSFSENELKRSRYVPELKLYELRAEKYNGMVRLLKPGCRTIILITDLKTRHKLIPTYHKSVWPYRRSKTLIFGHMLIEKGLLWYSELLRLSLGENHKLSINPRNCVGTVLAINGHRKYFCMYHAKHPESKGGTKRMMKITNHLLKRSDDLEFGGFFEIETTEDSENESQILLEENLLDGLSNWLDRLFEGTTHRYYINYWPDFPTK